MALKKHHIKKNDGISFPKRGDYLKKIYESLNFILFSFIIFPKISNIAATFSIGGIGFEKTKVIIIADPKVKKNIAEIHADGSFGNLKVVLENNPSINPKTSKLTAMSIILSLNKRKSSFLCSF